MRPKSTTGGSLEAAEQAALWCMRLADGQLTAIQQEQFAGWLEADPSNRLLFEEAAATWGDFEGADLDQEFLQMRAHALNEAGRRRWRLSGRRLQIALLAAAVVLLMLGGGVWAWRIAPATYHTDIGERRVVVLEDGSRLLLDAETTVRVRYTGARRELQLVRGRAKFDVAKDPLRPFSVAVSDKVVVATGTEFSVELLQKQLHVVLYEGHVAVLERKRSRAAPQPLRLAGTSIPADQRLTPGRELVAPERSGSASVAPTDPSKAQAWEAGQLVFVDEPLASAVEQVNRYTTEKLTVADAAAAETRVTGVFTAGDVQAFIDGVSAVFPVQVVARDTGRVFVSARPPR